MSLTNKRDPKGFIACLASIVRKQICNKFSTKQKQSQQINKNSKIVRNPSYKHREYNTKYCKKTLTKKIRNQKNDSIYSK